MTGALFAAHWAGRDPVAFAAALPEDRRAAMVEAHRLALACAEPDGWGQGGALHVAIDDEHYAAGTVGEPRPDEVDACRAWDALTPDERSVVVAWRFGYDPVGLPDPLPEVVEGAPCSTCGGSGSVSPFHCSDDEFEPCPTCWGSLTR